MFQSQGDRSALPRYRTHCPEQCGQHEDVRTSIRRRFLLLSAGKSQDGFILALCVGDVVTALETVEQCPVRSDSVPGTPAFTRVTAFPFTQTRPVLLNSPWSTADVTHIHPRDYQSCSLAAPQTGFI
jgi:hypothetical protein